MGIAFISDLGATKLAQGYLALVIPERFYPGNESDPPLTLRLPQHSASAPLGIRANSSATRISLKT